MELFSDIVEFGNRYVWKTPEVLPWIIAVLLGAGMFVTARLLFIQVRRVGHAIRVVLGRYDDPNDPGDVSHFQALSTALSATVGIGNIAGVATAIHYGGPGAVFWMWVTAFFGMALKFAECTLSLHYRKFDDRGDAAGGPMYYIEHGLGKAWKPLAVFFAVCAIVSSFGGGNMNQANTVALSASTDFGVSVYVVGAILAVAVGVVIIGGIRSIARVASGLAPTMAAVYILGALVILFLNAGDIPGAFATIFSSAFSPQASLGGSVAGTLSMTLLWGVKRGLFSNEAGQGSAPIAHAAAKTDEPVREGAVAMLGPLIDTLIICTMTALVIVVTGVWDKKKPQTMAFDDATAVAIAKPVMQCAVKGPPPSKCTPSHYQVVAGSPKGVSFRVSDGLVDNPSLTFADGPKAKQPFTGTLVLASGNQHLTLDLPVRAPKLVNCRKKHSGDKPKCKDIRGSLSVRDPAGKQVSLTLSGNMLQNSSALTAWGFQEGLSPVGDWGNLVVTICVFLFALSTMISWSYYGDRCVTYLFGSKYVIFYRLVFIGFVFLGAITALEVVWAYGDLALGLMTVPNLIAVVLLMPKILQLTRDYFARMDKADRDALPKAKVRE